MRKNWIYKWAELLFELDLICLAATQTLDSSVVISFSPPLCFVVSSICIHVRLLSFTPQYMLRQGKPAVQALHEVEVLTTDYVGEETLLTGAAPDRHSAACPMTVHTIVRGRLHIRTGNIGKHRRDYFPLNT